MFLYHKLFNKKIEVMTVKTEFRSSPNKDGSQAIRIRFEQYIVSINWLDLF